MVSDENSKQLSRFQTVDIRGQGLINVSHQYLSLSPFPRLLRLFSRYANKMSIDICDGKDHEVAK